MDLSFWVDFFLHLDKYLDAIIRTYGTWTYLILFLIIFIETGLVIMPFLPGDSLLFAAGAFAAIGSLDPVLLFVLVEIAAVLGDTVNYWIGAYIGPRAFSGKVRFLKKEYLDRTQVFYDKYGGITIIIARFVPIVRTFAPFVAGVGKMKYGQFFLYNVIGGVLWTQLFVFAGYFFGNIAFVRDNFSLVVIAIILISILPGIFEFVRNKRKKKTARTPEA
jgi:membrane-associated protein